MCEVPSWIEAEDGKVIWLTDKDVIDHLQTQPNQICWSDWTGHTGIRKVYSRLEGKDKEGFPCPEAILKDILSGKMNRICRVAENKAKWPVEMAPILTQLSKDENYLVRKCVSRNQNTPVEILTQLSKDESWDVRECVSGNQNTPVEIL